MDLTQESKPLLLLGAGGHAKVLLSLARTLGLEVAGICDPLLASQGAREWRGVRVLGGDEALAALDPASVGLVNGIGQMVGSSLRHRLFVSLVEKGFHFPVLVHPAAWVDATARLGAGVQVMAGAVIQADAVIGANSIINTCAAVDHDCRLGENVHVAPGATLCGNVDVGDQAFIAAGATVIQGISVGVGAVVGAGAVLVRDLGERQTIIGHPARKRPDPAE